MVFCITAITINIVLSCPGYVADAESTITPTSKSAWLGITVSAFIELLNRRYSNRAKDWITCLVVKLIKVVGDIMNNVRR